MCLQKKSVMMAVAICAAANISFAQIYTLSPDDSIYVNAGFEDLETLTIQQVNTSTDTLHLEWVKVSETLPASWEAAVCDNQTCYTTLVDSGSMNPVFPGEYGFILIHCTARINYGTAVIRYAVWDIKSPAKKDTLTFIINASSTGIQSANVSSPVIRLLQNHIFLENVSEKYETISLTAINGKAIYYSTVINVASLQLPPLSTGVYIITLNGKQNQFKQKILINDGL